MPPEALAEVALWLRLKQDEYRTAHLRMSAGARAGADPYTAGQMRHYDWAVGHIAHLLEMVRCAQSGAVHA
jgi:hypothetical protein